MNTGMSVAAIFICAFTILPGCDSVGDELELHPGTPDTLTAATIPPRPASAISGEEFLDQTRGASYAERQARAVCEIIAGNIPENLRTLAPVRFTAARESDTLTVWVTRDYISIGPNGDDVRMPLSLPSARAVAEAFDMLLPTTRMVDAIYAQSDLKLTPQPMTPGPEMRSNDYYGRHQAMIEEQRAGRSPNGLIAGHKKDLVVSTQMYSRTDRVAIYGWHRGIGDPIQPLYLGHVDHYEDYSHGLRLVWPNATLGGEMVPIGDLLGDAAWRPVLSDEQSLLIESLSRPVTDSGPNCD